jgi:hypothetical protein
VPHEDELDARCAQRLDDVEVLLAGHGEDAIDPSFSRALTNRSEAFMVCLLE